MPSDGQTVSFDRSGRIASGEDVLRRIVETGQSEHVYVNRASAGPLSSHQNRDDDYRSNEAIDPTRYILPKDEKGRKPFATLADEFRAALVDTKRIGYPLEMLTPEVRRRANAECRAVLPILHRAHRMVLDADFTALAGNLAKEEPINLARYLDLARLPFDHLWLEWPQPARDVAIVGRNYKKDSHIPKHAGMLIWPVEGIYYSIVVTGYTNQGGLPTQCGPSPIGMVFSMTQDIWDHPGRILIDPDDPAGKGEDSYYAAAQQDIDECPIGFHYMQALRQLHPDQVKLAEAIGRHASISIAPPFGPLHRETIMNARTAGHDDVIERQSDWLGINTREVNGLWRFLIAVFGLYHTGGSEFVYSETKHQKKQAYRSGHLPAYEYRIVTLRRPTTPAIVNKTLPSTSTLGRREHTVEGSWHHRRLATAECRRHPKACPIAVWHPINDDETGEFDQKQCGICKRIKWFVPEHTRGDAVLGRVDKGIRVAASGTARSVEIVEKVDLPPNIKIKSLPRFDAVQQHGEKTD